MTVHSNAFEALYIPANDTPWFPYGESGCEVQVIRADPTTGHWTVKLRGPGGALEYLDSQGNTLAHEDWRSIIQKYLDFCTRQGLESADVTRPRMSSPDRIAAA